MVEKLNSVQTYKIRKLISNLANKKGRGTELVSLYIPAKKAIHEVTNSLREEHGTASNIKSDTTRNHVQDALTKTLQRLKFYKKTPINGLIIFTGALPTNGPGSETVILNEILPPKPVQTYFYRCDDHFHLEFLKSMLKVDDVFGILSIDNTETGFALIAGDRLDIIDVITSGVSGKHRAGGQSARRYERLRNMDLNAYYHRIAAHASKAFLEQENYKGLLVSGPGPTKDYFLKEKYLDYRLQESVKGVLDTSYSGHEGIREALMKSSEILSNIRIMEEKQLVQKFLKEVNVDSGLAIYGINQILEKLRNSSVELILISDNSGFINLKIVCKQCENIINKTIKKLEIVANKENIKNTSCVNCNSNEYDVMDEDIIDYFDDQVNQYGTKLEIISSKSEDGVMLESFGGLGALLRFK